MLDPRPSDDLGEGAREILDDHDRPRPGVVELVLELARGVKGVRVDHREAGEQYPEYGDGIRQEIRHHDGDAVPGVEAESLKPGGKRAGALVQILVADGDPEVRVGRPIAEAADALLEQGHDRIVGVDIRLRRDSFGIALEPDPVHRLLPLRLLSIFLN